MYFKLLLSFFLYLVILCCAYLLHIKKANFLLTLLDKELHICNIFIFCILKLNILINLGLFLALRLCFYKNLKFNTRQSDLTQNGMLISIPINQSIYQKFVIISLRPEQLQHML